LLFSFWIIFLGRQIMSADGSLITLEDVSDWLEQLGYPVSDPPPGYSKPPEIGLTTPIAQVGPTKPTRVPPNASLPPAPISDPCWTCGEWDDNLAQLYEDPPQLQTGSPAEGEHEPPQPPGNGSPKAKIRPRAPEESTEYGDAEAVLWRCCG